MQPLDVAVTAPHVDKLKAPATYTDQPPGWDTQHTGQDEALTSSCAFVSAKLWPNIPGPSTSPAELIDRLSC